MFENLSDKLQRVFKTLRGEGKLSAENMDAALREIRVALLEADVHFRVTKQFIEAVREKAMGVEVLTALSPSQQVVKIVRDEMVKMLGTHQAKLRMANEPPSVIMIVGLQGSGKTTSTGKLARSALREARQTGRDVVLVDTAGRLHIDDQLMQELQQLKDEFNPTEVLFVADAMTGQDAVNSADEFHKKLSLTGIVLTKMDGDARGGAALSIRQVTGQPIKFIGVGEKYDALEPFHPDRIVSRILGMGDILSLIERAESQIDKKKAQEMATKALTGDGFSLEDFRDQLRQVKKMGSMKSLMGMLPSIGPFSGLQKAADNIDEKQINRVEAIINSMTTHERNHHEVINGNRRKRIARGSGTTVQEVNNLLRQYAQMKKMFKQMGKPSFARRLAGMKMPGM